MRPLFLLWAAGALSLAARAPEYDSCAVRSVMAPMRDGVRLAADVYLPATGGQAAAGRFPTLIYRSPYGKRSGGKDAESLARRGYAAVVQDCRGRFASEGEFYPYRSDGRDGYDTIEWAAAQPWSDGRVGTSGASYLGLNQYLAAAERPPHLAAMFVLVAGADQFHENLYAGGAPTLGWAFWLIRMAATSPEADRNPLAALALAGPLQKLPQWLMLPPRERLRTLAPFPAYARAYRDFLEHPIYDDYWQQIAFGIAGHYEALKDVPIFFLSGWYDFQIEGVLANFAALSKLQKTPKRLLIGPWPHSTGAAECGDAAFGSTAAVDQRALEADWFDHWLRGRPFEVVAPEPVRYFRMGGGDGRREAGKPAFRGGEWRTDKTWPPDGVRPLRLYLEEGGGLARESAAAGGSSSFVFDPEHPAPMIGGRTMTGDKGPKCVQDQPAARPDILSFATPPLAAPLSITGAVKARLYVSSSAPETDFTAKLVDLWPDGYAMNLLEGQIRTRYRDGQGRATPLAPGASYEVEIALGSTSNLFQKGHRIRLDVSSSSFPRFEPNPNMGEPPHPVEPPRPRDQHRGLSMTWSNQSALRASGLPDHAEARGQKEAGAAHKEGADAG